MKRNTNPCASALRPSLKNLLPRPHLLSLLISVLIVGAPLCAQDANNLSDVINRVGILEEDNRTLRGMVEELTHEVSLLKQHNETFAADVEYRLSEDGHHKPHKEDHEISEPTSKDTASEPMVSTPSATPEEEYKKALSLLEQGDYAAAESTFSAFLESHPKDKLAGAAHYWLGVTFFARDEHSKAAAHFAKGHKKYPHSSKAADNLLKLAKSLGALDRKADACMTLEQLSSAFPKVHKDEVRSERQKMGCS